MTMICAHARWDNQHAFGQSRISLDTESTSRHSSSSVKPSPHFCLEFHFSKTRGLCLGSIWVITVVVVSRLKQTFL